MGTSNAQNVYRPGFPLAPPGAAGGQSVYRAAFPLAPPGAAGGQSVYRPAFPRAPAGATLGSDEDVSASIPGPVLLIIRAIHLTKKDLMPNKNIHQALTLCQQGWSLPTLFTADMPYSAPINYL